MEDFVAVGFPFVSAVVYAVASLLVKRATNGKIGALTVCFVINALIFVVYMPLFIATFNLATLHCFKYVLLCAVIYLAGQYANYVAFSKGDITVVNPVLGVKTLLVAIFASIFTQRHISDIWFLAAILSVAGVLFVGTEKLKVSKKEFLPVFFAIFAAAAWAAMDIVMQENASKMGVLFFISSLSIILLPLSLPLLPVAKKELKNASRATVAILLLGAALMILKDVLFCYSLSVSKGGAVLANILVSTRGLFTILIAWLFGAVFGNFEMKKVSFAFAVRRLIGAIFLFFAAFLVLFYR